MFEPTRGRSGLKMKELSSEIELINEKKGEIYMKKNFLHVLMALFLSAAVFVSCTSEKDTETEKGAIDNMTDRAAKEMADSIQIPLERARAAAKQQEDKMRELDEALRDK